MTKPKRPDVRYNELVEGPDITVSCGRCGEEMEHHDGFACACCGLDYGEDGRTPEIDGEWVYYAQQRFPDATAEQPAHLLVWPRDSAYGKPGTYAWVLHLGCPHAFMHGVECPLRDATSGYGALDAVEVAEGIPYELVDYYVDKKVVRLLPGVYRIELTGVQLVPVRVAQCLGVVDPTDGPEAHPSPYNLVELTAELVEDAFRPAGKVRPAPVTSPALRVAEVAEKFL